MCHLKSIVDVLSARSSSEALAYVFLADGTSESEIRWTFADTVKNSRAFAAHLRDRGISAGDRVVLALNPSLEYIAALYGIMQLGAIPVPCFPPLRPKELDRFHAITVDCSPKGIVIDEMYRGQMEALRGRLNILQPRTGGRLRRAWGGEGRRRRSRVERTERPRADPVHIWLDGISKRGLPHPRQPGEQLRSSWAAAWATTPTGSVCHGYRHTTTWD